MPSLHSFSAIGAINAGFQNENTGITTTLDRLSDTAASFEGVTTDTPGFHKARSSGRFMPADR
jgi:hypothetical protein